MAQLLGTVEYVAQHTFNQLQRLEFGLETNQIINSHKHAQIIRNQLKQLKVHTSSRFYSLAGRAIMKHRFINSHIILHPACVDIDDNVFQRGHGTVTFFHELAHIAAYFTTLHHGHGFPWQYSLMQFGFKPERCYNSKQIDFRSHKKRKEQRLVNEIIENIPDLGI